MPTTQVGIFPPHSYAVLFGVLPFSLDKTPSPGGEPLCQRLAAWCLVAAACPGLQPVKGACESCSE